MPPLKKNLIKELPHTYAMYCSNQEWVPYDFLRTIALHIFKKIKQGNARIIINLPPRHGKSMFFKWVILWYLEIIKKHVIYCSYNNETAKKNTKFVKDNIVNNKKVNLKLKDGHAKQAELKCTNNAEFCSAGLMGSITGSGGHLIILDDLVKDWADCLSREKMRSLREWFTGVLYSRLEVDYVDNKPCPGGIVVINTRWSKLDLCEYLMKSPDEGGHGDEWEVIKLPAIATSDDDFIGRTKGEPLCPERFPIKRYNAIKKGMTEENWLASYQQNPITEKTNTFKKSYLNTYEELPDNGKYIIACDPSVKDKKTAKAKSGPDYYAYVVFYYIGKKRYIVEVKKFQGNITIAIKYLSILVSKYRPEATIMENKANGPAIQQLLSHRFDIELITPLGSKTERAEATLPEYQEGFVHVPSDPDKNPWLEDFIDELTSFPASEHDDQVDAFTQGMIYLSDYYGEKPKQDACSYYEDLCRL